MTSGERIKILRILNGFTLEALSEFAKVSRSSVRLWQMDKVPTPRTAIRLALLFDVCPEYLLKGTNKPDHAFWKLSSPGHPAHLEGMASDIRYGTLLLFRELEINFAVKGQGFEGKEFWLFGNNPENIDWRLNYLLIYDTSLDTLLSPSIRAAGLTVTDIGQMHSFQGYGNLINDAAKELYDRYSHYPDCTRLYDRLGGLESEGDDDFTLEGLLKRFGRKVADEKMNITDDDIERMAHYMAKEVSVRTGLSNIKISATKLLRAAVKHAR